jgi:hypothetical protein
MPRRPLTSLIATLLLAIALAPTLSADDAVKKPEKLLRHVVLFQFKSNVTEAQIKEVSDAFAALPKKIDAIHDFEWGIDVSVEGKAQGFTHGFLVTFRSKEDRDAYLPHPEHKKFVELVGPRIQNVLVFDYWTRAD